MSPNEEKQWFSGVQASYPWIDSIFPLVNVSVLRSKDAIECQDVVFDCRDWTLKFATKQTCVAKIKRMMASQSEMEKNRSSISWDSSFGLVNYEVRCDVTRCEMPFLVETSHPTDRAGLVPEKGGLVINDKVSRDSMSKTSARMDEVCSYGYHPRISKMYQMNPPSNLHYEMGELMLLQMAKTYEFCSTTQWLCHASVAKPQEKQCVNKMVFWRCHDIDLVGMDFLLIIIF